jgi:RND superfamily putative drug exporter
VVTAAAMVTSISFAALIAAHVPSCGCSLMRVLGTWCWWAPTSLARLHERFGISEGSAVRTSQPTRGRHRISRAATAPARHAFQEG